MTHRKPNQPGAHPKALIMFIGAVVSGAAKAVVGWLLGRFAE